tara:strand:+ start:6054 stop:6200 length:147 start_codon:yes stop_codon:yes gene_type:complete
VTPVDIQVKTIDFTDEDSAIIKVTIDGELFKGFITTNCPELRMLREEE